MLRVRPLSQEGKDRPYELLDHPDPQIRKGAKSGSSSESEGWSANEMVPSPSSRRTSGPGRDRGELEPAFDPQGGALGIKGLE